ncbi:ATP synthase F1, gamma subunit [Ureaplasma urealyticum serovar 10 str. ATCC 33699]|uniref:ATP synthase gamma chain n=1 Tax=Ureaplasma urealyticum serovar 10 (strain ATCC 33699 / Western) TaxID=565575 RepID=ATPG_UREU1|nr:ATP synthase F1 subunit gamma [Ureaplasma urealyticum]B5ZAW2.1 RecName: Full=ATP synthase gamma chain; AltName: Full=ATP synthase F1 sector gamma subunit; AltName: Full=F-ATPase gamma subunit [Ureaplasma urealyticum serovar 10 str. ATCC 33699]ACI60000.1 ATP synthase F1, gamma subunit [Ureaplasma urealyticum serovar 10 str. ATCC 33699]
MSLDAIKRKISSVQTTAKITNAMKLVATAKLKRQRDRLAAIKEYCHDYYDVIGLLLSVVNDIEFLKIPNAKNRTLYITINSTMGLAGSYNYNVNKLVSKIINEDDITFTIGKKGHDFMRLSNRLHQVNTYLNLNDNDLTFDMSLQIAREALELYSNGEVNKICIIYTKFINAITFEVNNIDVLPFDKTVLTKDNLAETIELAKDNIIFQPNKVELVKKILPTYIATVLYGSLIESKISENASRRNAMDAATKNAKALAEDYKLIYNTLRQGKITREITEIVAGSDD